MPLEQTTNFWVLIVTAVHDDIDTSILEEIMEVINIS